MQSSLSVLQPLLMPREESKTERMTLLRFMDLDDLKPPATPSTCIRHPDGRTDGCTGEGIDEWPPRRRRREGHAQDGGECCLRCRRRRGGDINLTESRSARLSFGSASISINTLTHTRPRTPTHIQALASLASGAKRRNLCQESRVEPCESQR